MHLLSLVLLASATSARVLPDLPELEPRAKAALNTALVPQFGVTRGTSPDGHGNCLGANAAGAPVKIPCFCPPDRQEFLAKMTAAAAAGSFLGSPITFNNNAADTSIGAIKGRATASIIVLQSFNGTKGVGCPGASAPDFLIQQSTGKVV